MKQKFEDVLNELKKFENFYCLKPATDESFNNTTKLFQNLPLQLQQWFKMYDGGSLIDMDLFSFEGKNGLKQINSQKNKAKYNIPEYINVFGITSYGNYIGYDINTKKITEVDVENSTREEWNLFGEWLLNFLCDTQNLINDGLIEPNNL